MATTIENQLLSRARSGDSAALGTLLDGYRNYLHLLATPKLHHQLRGKLDPSDVVQETLLIASERFEQFRGQSQGEFVAWLRQVLSTCLISAYRRYLGAQQRAVELEQQLVASLNETSQSIELMAEQSSPSGIAVRNERIVLVTSILQQLKDEYRQILLMRHVDGHTFGEIGIKMSRSEDATRKMWLRAVAEFQRLIAGESQS